MVNVIYTTYYTHYAADGTELGTSSGHIRETGIQDRDFAAPDFPEHEKNIFLAEEQPESYLDPYKRAGYRDRLGFHPTDKPVTKMQIQKTLFFEDGEKKSLGVMMVNGVYDVANGEFDLAKDRPVVLKLSGEGKEFREKHAEKPERGGLYDLINNAEKLRDGQDKDVSEPVKDEQEIG